MRNRSRGGFYNGELGDYEELDFQQKMKAVAARTDVTLRKRVADIFYEVTSQYMLHLPGDLDRLSMQVSDAVVGLSTAGPTIIADAIRLVVQAETGWTEEQTIKHIGINLMPYINAALAAENRKGILR